MSASEPSKIKPRYIGVDDHQEVLKSIAKERKSKREVAKARAEVLHAQARVVELEAEQAEASEEREDIIRNVRVKYDLAPGFTWDDITRQISERPVE